MDRIQTDGNLHALAGVHRRAVSQIHPSLLKRRPSVRETVLHHQILRRFGVNERRDISLPVRDHDAHILHAVTGQRFRHSPARTRCDLVNHAPWKGSRRLVAQIPEIPVLHKSAAPPLLRDSQNGFPQLFSVPGNIVRGDKRNRQRPRLKAPVQQSGRQRHRAVQPAVRTGLKIRPDRRGELTVRSGQHVSFLRDGIGHQLKRRVRENLFQTRPDRPVIGACRQCLRQRADHPFLSGTVFSERDAERQIVIRAVDPVDHVEIERLHAGDPPVEIAGGNQIIGDHAVKHAENVSNPEMHPAG